MNVDKFIPLFQVQAWENDELSGRYETMEEIWDLLVIENTLYTARCLDVVVTEMKPGIFLFQNFRIKNPKEIN